MLAAFEILRPWPFRSASMLRGLSLIAVSRALADELKSSDVTATCLLKGSADESQCSEIVKYSEDCFSWNPINTANVGSLSPLA